LPTLVLSGCFHKETPEPPTYEKPEHAESSAVLPTVERYVLLSVIQLHAFQDEQTFWQNPTKYLQIIFPEMDLSDFSDMTQETFSQRYAGLNQDITKNLNWIQTYKYLNQMATLSEDFSPDIHAQLDLEPNPTIGNIQTPTPFWTLNTSEQKQIAAFIQHLLSYETQKQTNILQTLQSLQKLPEDPDALPNEQRKFFLKMQDRSNAMKSALERARDKFPHVDFFELYTMSFSEFEDVLFEASVGEE